MFSKIFDFSSRINRLQFVAGLVFLTFLKIFIGLTFSFIKSRFNFEFTPNDPVVFKRYVFYAIFLLPLCLYIILGSKRLRDMGRSPAWLAIQVIPMLAAFAFLVGGLRLMAFVTMALLPLAQNQTLAMLFLTVILNPFVIYGMLFGPTLWLILAGSDPHDPTWSDTDVDRLVRGYTQKNSPNMAKVSNSSPARPAFGTKYTSS